MKKLIYITILLIILISTQNIFALSSNISTNGRIVDYPTKNEIIKSEDIYIKYIVTNGLSATGSTLMIKQNGEVRLETLSKKTTLVNKINKKNLTKNEFTNLKSTINKAKLFNLKDLYKCEKNCPTDLNSTFIEFHYYNKIKYISLSDHANYPKELAEVIKILKTLQIKTLNAK